jgi:hypothetical protein
MSEEITDVNEEIENTYIRKMCKDANPYLNKLIGSYYWFIHIFIMISGGIILLFDNNIYHLFMLLVIASLDGLACIILHDCPLTILENKYLKTTIIDKHYNYFNNCNILYKCEHKYEKTLEFLTTMISSLFGKINLLILMKLFSFKVNTSNS